MFSGHVAEWGWEGIGPGQDGLKATHPCMGSGGRKQNTMITRGPPASPALANDRCRRIAVPRCAYER
jgi:hypothetical protein